LFIQADWSRSEQVGAHPENLAGATDVGYRDFMPGWNFGSPAQFVPECEHHLMPTPKLTNEIITAAIEGFEAQKRRIDGQIADLRALLTGRPVESTAAVESPKPGRRKMSAAGRKAIAEAQRKRWAASKAAAGVTAEVVAKPRRKMSAAARKAIGAATKKRWALKRAEAAKAK
jgi:hypothetical protein